jgi:hypothetical protein
MTEMTVADIRHVARLVFDENFPAIERAAREEASRRVNALIAELDSKLANTVTREQLNRFQLPEIQYTLNVAVQAAALKDDAQLRALLAELVCLRVKEESDLGAIVYSEAIATLPKLTPALLNLLAFTVLVTRTYPHIPNTWQDLRHLYAHSFAPLLNFSSAGSEIEHLAYCGCGNVGLMGRIDGSFMSHFRLRFPQLFHRLSAFAPKAAARFPDYFEKGDSEISRLRADAGERFELDTGERKKAIGAIFFEQFRGVSECQQLLLENAPEYLSAIEKWDSPYLPMFNLTSVGFAIGKTHLQSVTGLVALPAEPKFEHARDLAGWIPTA